MTAEIAVTELEGLLEEPEICLVGLGEDREYAQTHSLMDGVVEELRRMCGAHLFDWILIPVMIPARAALNDKASAG